MMETRKFCKVPQKYFSKLMVENEKYQSHYDLHLRMLSYHCLQKNLIFIFLLVGVVCMSCCKYRRYFQNFWNVVFQYKSSNKIQHWNFSLKSDAINIVNAAQNDGEYHELEYFITFTKFYWNILNFKQEPARQPLHQQHPYVTCPTFGNKTFT